MSLSEHDKKQITAVLEETVKRVVNGKIDTLKQSLDEHILKHDANNSALQATMDEMNAKINPVYEAYSSYSGARKVLISLSVTVGSLAGLGLGIKQIILFLKSI